MITVGYSLKSAWDTTRLATVLPLLRAGEALRFDCASAQLLCLCDDQGSGDVRPALGDGLAALCGADMDGAIGSPCNEPWPQFHGDAVLTVIVPAAVALPEKLFTGLQQQGARPLSVRCLSPLGMQSSAAFEVYLENQAPASFLHELSERAGIDLAITPADSKRPRRRLIAFDMDSTLIQCEVIDELARRAGVGDRVAAITERAMRGELDFRSSFRERMTCLRGLDAAEIASVAAALPIMPGAVELLRSLRAAGHYTVILSGGFDYFARQLQETLGIDESHANHLQVINGQLSGEVEGDIVDGERKVKLLRAIARKQGFSMEDTVAVGDGANDLPMLAAAGLGVAFHAKPLVREKAPCAVSYSDLDALLFLLG